MNVPPSLKADDLDALIKELIKPRIVGNTEVEVEMISGGVTRPPSRQAYETPGWEPSPYYYDYKGGIAGRLNGHDVFLDRRWITPRMAVSRSFAEIQDPKLVKETQEWMNSFFGVDYPIHLYVDTLYMHPEALRKLLRVMDEQHEKALSTGVL